MFKRGDPVIFRMPKHTAHPGPRAAEVQPEPMGEFYTYVVDKFWVVDEVRGQKLVLRTRRGKRHEVASDDPRLRRPSFWERLKYHWRFPALG